MSGTNEKIRKAERLELPGDAEATGSAAEFFVLWLEADLRRLEDQYETSWTRTSLKQAYAVDRG